MFCVFHFVEEYSLQTTGEANIYWQKWNETRELCKWFSTYFIRELQLKENQMNIFFLISFIDMLNFNTDTIHRNKEKKIPLICSSLLA